MKKTILKISTITFFAVLMTITIKINPDNSGSDLVLGATETLASIPCHSQAKRNWNYAYVDCASCTRLTGWRAIGDSGSCSTGGGGNGGPQRSSGS